MAFTRRGAYDQFDSLAEAKRHYRRCRTLKMFILSAEGAARRHPICRHCRRPIVNGSNRIEWVPPRRKGRQQRPAVVIPLHYDCSWQVLFEDIVRLGNRM